MAGDLVEAGVQGLTAYAERGGGGGLGKAGLEVGVERLDKVGAGVGVSVEERAELVGDEAFELGVADDRGEHVVDAEVVREEDPGPEAEGLAELGGLEGHGDGAGQAGQVVDHAGRGDAEDVAAGGGGQLKIEGVDQIMECRAQ